MLADGCCCADRISDEVLRLTLSTAANSDVVPGVFYVKEGAGGECLVSVPQNLWVHDSSTNAASACTKPRHAMQRS